MRYRNSVGSIIWFFRLWLVVGLVVAMLVVVEMAFLTAGGYQYRSKKYVERDGLRERSLVDETQYADIFFFRERDGTKPVRTELRIHDGSALPRVIPFDEIAPSHVAYSIDRKLAFSTMQGEIFLAQLSQEQLGPKKLAQSLTKVQLARQTKAYFQQVAFSPNGQFLVSNHSDGIFVWEANSLERLVSADEPNESFLCFFADSSRIVTTSQRGVLRIRNLLSPQTYSDVVVGECRIDTAAISPNAELAVTSSHRGLTAWSLTKNCVLWKKNGPYFPAVVMSDEFVFYLSGNTTTITVSDAVTGKTVHEIRNNDKKILDLKLIEDRLDFWGVCGQFYRFSCTDLPNRS